MIYNGSDKHKQALFENKQDKLTAGDNISLTPLSDGTVRIDADGGGSGTVTDVLVDGVSVVNQDGEAEITMPPVPSDLDDLSDVNVSSLSDGDVLKYNSTTQKWENGEAGGGNVDDVQMNGVSIVDVNKVASFNNYVELTQAQYDALPASKLTDGVLYCIKDTGIVEGDKYAPIIYSLEEREVGVWTDGKPLYSKTVHITSLPSSTSTSGVNYPHNISNIDTICTYDATARWSNGNNTHLNHSVFTSGAQNSSITIVVSKTDINIVVGIDRSSMNADVTIYYTKTTDVAGSGTWGTDGVPMVHYDGTERIIGTWFGETLYQKSFIIPISSQSGDITHTVDSDINVVNALGIIKTSGGFEMALPASYSNIFWCGLQHDSNYIRLSIYSASDWQRYNTLTEAVVTLQYTKTT